VGVGGFFLGGGWSFLRCVFVHVYVRAGVCVCACVFVCDAPSPAAPSAWPSIRSSGACACGGSGSYRRCIGILTSPSRLKLLLTAHAAQL
jgi:hypothetical protein